jgi:hypothetical protein
MRTVISFVADVAQLDNTGGCIAFRGPTQDKVTSTCKRTVGLQDRLSAPGQERDTRLSFRRKG